MNLSTARALEKSKKACAFKFFDNPIWGTVTGVHELSSKDEDAKTEDQQVAHAHGAGEVQIEDSLGRMQWYPLHFLSFGNELEA